MADPTVHKTEVVIAGGGLAGIATAHELLDRGKKVLLIEKDSEDSFGGLAKESFGGVHLIDTPHQRRQGLRDHPDLAWQDWSSYAQFGPDDELPRRWARLYCDSSMELIYPYLDGCGVEFLPVVNWPERGLDRPGNSVPRWHIAWGTGHAIATCAVGALDRHPRRADLTMLFDTEVSDVELTDGRARGVVGRSMRDGRSLRVEAEHVVIASGGICGGDLSTVRRHWYAPWGEPPKVLLNGAHRYGDGLLHERVEALGGRLTHLDKHWHYAAGVHHPARRRPADGLSLVPARSALWLDPRGRRIGPRPLVPYTDTRHFVETILKLPGQYSWQVMNWKIAARELGVSGCDYMTTFRHKKKLRLAWELLFGNHELVRRLTEECHEDIVTADTPEALMDGMQERSLDDIEIDRDGLRADVEAYDAMIERGQPYFNDEQLRRIQNFRTYRGDRFRVCRFQRIFDPKARPYIAVRQFILARKSLGGIQTDLDGRVMRAEGEPIDGLYAVGEAAGFGGGGIHGVGSLEGTFLGSCVLTGRVVGRSIGRA